MSSQNAAIMRSLHGPNNCPWVPSDTVMETGFCHLAWDEKVHMLPEGAKKYIMILSLV
jgi:hypothetical protein